MKKTLLAISVLTIACVVGCSSENADVKSSKLSPCCSECECSASATQYLSVAKEVLSEMQFRVDKYDIDQGYLRTQPLRAGQLLEPWRKDTVGSFNMAEANLQSIIRTVEVTACPGTAADEFGIIVTTQRLALDSEDVVSISQAREIFTDSKSGQQRLVLSMDTDRACWVNLGRDCELEQKIKQLICEKINSK